MKTPETSDSRLYRPISEVAEIVGVKPHVLRYWESQFSMLRPRKNRAGNRMYRPEEVKLLFRIKELLYDRRFTIAGARRHLLDQRKDGAPVPAATNGAVDRKLALREIRLELESIATRLKAVPRKA